MNIEITHRYTNTVLCSFESVDIKDCLQQAVKSGADLGGADLRGAYLVGADLGGASLGGASLGGAYLGGAYLGGAYLVGASLGGADLRGADLGGAYLVCADLRGADLRGADLRGAYLGGAYLGGADLRGADLRGADLRGEKIAIAPILIGGLIWSICISESYLEIGCQRHLHAEWSKFSDEEIAKMESRASEFWKLNKSWLLAACTSHRKQSLNFRKLNEESEK